MAIPAELNFLVRISSIQLICLYAFFRPRQGFPRVFSSRLFSLLNYLLTQKPQALDGENQLLINTAEIFVLAQVCSRGLVPSRRFRSQKPKLKAYIFLYPIFAEVGVMSKNLTSRCFVLPSSTKSQKWWSNCLIMVRTLLLVVDGPNEIHGKH